MKEPRTPSNSLNLTFLIRIKNCSYFLIPKSPQGKYTNHTSPEWTEKERELIFKKFKIDFTDHSAYNDRSLLTHSFVLNLHQKGRILSIELPIELRNILYNFVRQRADHSLFWELITYPDSLPSLCPPKVSLQKTPIQWVTHGKLKDPLDFHHTRLLQDRSFWLVNTSGESAGQQWLIKWLYHPLTQRLLQFDLAWFAKSHRTQKVWQPLAQYQLKFHCQFQYIEPAETTEKLQDFSIAHTKP